MSRFGARRGSAITHSSSRRPMHPAASRSTSHSSARRRGKRRFFTQARKCSAAGPSPRPTELTPRSLTLSSGGERELRRCNQPFLVEPHRVAEPVVALVLRPRRLVQLDALQSYFLGSRRRDAGCSQALGQREEREVAQLLAVDPKRR